VGPVSEPVRRRRIIRPRWHAYRALLVDAQHAGYEIVSLEPWLRDIGPSTEGVPQLVLRHDVDQDVWAARRMAEVELELGVRSTWYLRWRTADRAVVSWLSRGGFDVGLHYETLTRRALERQLLTDPKDETTAAAEELAREIEAFRRFHPQMRSICPHGDTRMPGIRNGTLWERLPEAVRHDLADGNEDLRGVRVGARITDAGPPAPGWGDGPDPRSIFAARVGPVVLTTHPHHWAGTLSAVRRRAFARRQDRPDW